MRPININTNVDPKVFDLRKKQVKKLLAAGKKVWLNQNIQLIIGEEKYAAHLRLYPGETVLPINSYKDVPKDLDDALSKFFDASRPVSKEKVDDIAAILAEVDDEEEEEQEQPKKEEEEAPSTIEKEEKL